MLSVWIKKNSLWKMKFYRHTEEVACQLYTAVLGLKADGHNVGCYAGTAAGIVLSAVGNNRVSRHHRATWQVEHKFRSLHAVVLKLNFCSLHKQSRRPAPHWRWWSSIGSSILLARLWWLGKPWNHSRSRLGSWETGRHLPLKSDWCT